MEIKSLKLTFNVQNAYVTETVFNIVMKSIQCDGLNAQQLAGKIQKVLKDYCELLADFTSSNEDKRVLIEEAELFCAKNTEFLSHFHITLQCMYKLELVLDTQILEWGK